MLIAFYYSSSKLTKVGQERKRQMDAEFVEGGQRSYIQVCNEYLHSSTLEIPSDAVGALVLRNRNRTCGVSVHQV